MACARASGITGTYKLECSSLDVPAMTQKRTRARRDDAKGCAPRWLQISLSNIIPRDVIQFTSKPGKQGHYGLADADRKIGAIRRNILKKLLCKTRARDKDIARTLAGVEPVQTRWQGEGGKLCLWTLNLTHERRIRQGCQVIMRKICVHV